MNIRGKIFGASFCLLAVMAALVGFYLYMDYFRVDTSTIDYLEQAQTSNFKFSDLSGDIAVESIDDIGYVVEGPYQINIHYGRQRIKVNQQCFKSKEYMEALKRIGIVIKTHENEDGSVVYKVTCWKQDVQELANIK